MAIHRGVRWLRRLLRERTFDLRLLDVAGFRDWLGRLLPHWQRDPVFVQRARIRDLRRAHPELRALEQAERRAAAADAASPQAARLTRLERELNDTAKALAGLTAALARATADRRPALATKRAAFASRRQALEDEQARLTGASAARHDLLRARADLLRLRRAIGLEAEETRLQELVRQQGRRSGRAGTAFERQAADVTKRLIVPDLLRGGRRPMCVLHGVTLGAARVEFDQLVIRPARRPGGPVEVLAVVEAKRNINDVGHGFRLRQENLAWLTGDAAPYDPRLYRTSHFRSGHFDREAAHGEGGEVFHFAAESFRRFRREPAAGPFLRRLYLVTREGPIWGASAAVLARIAHRVATDERWRPDDDGYLGGLLAWCQALASLVETPEVLRAYAAAPAGGRRVLGLP